MTRCRALPRPIPRRRVGSRRCALRASNPASMVSGQIRPVTPAGHSRRPLAADRIVGHATDSRCSANGGHLSTTTASGCRNVVNYRSHRLTGSVAAGKALPDDGLYVRPQLSPQAPSAEANARGHGPEERSSGRAAADRYLQTARRRCIAGSSPAPGWGPRRGRQPGRRRWVRGTAAGGCTLGASACSLGSGFVNITKHARQTSAGSRLPRTGRCAAMVAGKLTLRVGAASDHCRGHGGQRPLPWAWRPATVTARLLARR